MPLETPPEVWGLLVLLLAASAFFSSSETAFFSLTASERRESAPPVKRLLVDPRLLLASVLLGNLVVNVLYFAVVGRLLDGEGGVRDVVVGLAALVGVLVFGEIVPKTFGLRLRVVWARLIARPLWLLVLVSAPLARPLVRLLEWFQRILTPVEREERTFSPEVLAHVMERGSAEGDLLDMEADLVSEVIELGQIRVREIMTPRVDAPFLDLSDRDRDGAVGRALQMHQSWLPVIDGHADRVVGRVRVRELLRHPDRPVARMVMPVKFVPEVASALDLLRVLKEDRTAEAVVVDEWGGTAGFVTAEDVFEEIVGDLRAEGESRVPAVVPLGERRYRVSGGLSIRDWNETFGRDVVPTEFETVGGFVTALIGRIPRTGDVARLENLVMQVSEVRGRRVETVDIGVEEPGGGDEEARG